MLDAALIEYKKKTGEDLQAIWLASELQTCESVDTVLDLLRDQAKTLEQSGDRKVMSGSIQWSMYSPPSQMLLASALAWCVS
jgi:hypothetical protein